MIKETWERFKDILEGYLNEDTRELLKPAIFYLVQEEKEKARREGVESVLGEIEEYFEGLLIALDAQKTKKALVKKIRDKYENT